MLLRNDGTPAVDTLPRAFSGGSRGLWVSYCDIRRALPPTATIVNNGQHGGSSVSRISSV